MKYPCTKPGCENVLDTDGWTYPNDIIERLICPEHSNSQKETSNDSTDD